MRYNLKQARTESGLSSTETAKAIGVSRRMYLYIESGERNPRIDIWRKLSELFNESIEYLEERGNNQ